MTVYTPDMTERSKRPTIIDVGRIARVSPATVSKALRGQPGVSEETRRRIERIARDVGYQASRAARTLPQGKTGFLGFRISADPSNVLMGSLLHSMVIAASRFDFEILVFTPKPGQAENEACAEVLSRGGADGFILSYLQPTDDRIAFLEEQGIEYVAFGHLPRTARGSWVDSSGAAALAEAVHHVAGLGRRRIGFVGWPRHQWVTGDIRHRGYLDAIRELGLDEDPTLDARVDGYTPDHGRAAYRALHSASPDAVVAVSDNLAIGVMHAAEELGLGVGKDLLVVGYDDIPAASDVSPALTTLRQPLETIGTRLVEVLLRHIDNPGAEAEGIEIRPELIVRQTTVPAD